VVADVDEAAVRKLADELTAEGRKALPVRCDVGEEAEVKAMLEKTKAEFGRLDAAFNNAAVQSPATDTADLTAEEWDRVSRVNIRGVFLCMKYELQLMRGQTSGAIVNCSSNSGLVGVPGRAAYATAKHGMPGLTKCTAIDYAPKGIRINAICPGTISTPMVMDMFKTGDLQESVVAALAPINRLGTPEEIADAVLWLCSPFSSYVIGQAIAVDGGYTII
ncbi:SDR family oxidoreductase, partial [Desulfovibrio sp. 1188_IL3213]|uniref:SDR family NAD(P)-dependent oxidoreductase n=1 Tax=Desulfovibrio sp. 1188_IL3213 TaxID=3084052 RepID=UPI002FDB69EA